MRESNKASSRERNKGGMKQYSLGMTHEVGQRAMAPALGSAPRFQERHGTPESSRSRTEGTKLAVPRAVDALTMAFLMCLQNYNVVVRSWSGGVIEASCNRARAQVRKTKGG